MRELPQLDQLLKDAADRGDVPGVVAMVATRDGPVYRGAYGRRALPDGPAIGAGARPPLFGCRNNPITPATTHASTSLVPIRRKIPARRAAERLTPRPGQGSLGWWPIATTCSIREPSCLRTWFCARSRQRRCC